LELGLPGLFGFFPFEASGTVPSFVVVDESFVDPDPFQEFLGGFRQAFPFWGVVGACNRWSKGWVDRNTLSTLARNHSSWRLQGISALSQFSQHPFMALEFSKRAGRDGNAILQQVQDHFADGVDLILVGVLQ